MAMGTHFHTFYFKNVVTFGNKECMLEMVLQNKENKESALHNLAEKYVN